MIKLALTDIFDAKENLEESLTLTEEADEVESSIEDLNKKFEAMSPSLKRRKTQAL